MRFVPTYHVFMWIHGLSAKKYDTTQVRPQPWARSHTNRVSQGKARHGNILANCSELLSAPGIVSTSLLHAQLGEFFRIAEALIVILVSFTFRWLQNHVSQTIWAVSRWCHLKKVCSNRYAKIVEMSLFRFNTKGELSPNAAQAYRKNYAIYIKDLLVKEAVQRWFYRFRFEWKLSLVIANQL